MCYDEALDKAKKKVEQFPQFKRNGRAWVRVGDKEFPKDWFVRNAVLEEIRKYKRQSVMEKKQHSLWNRPASDVMNGSQQNSTKNKSRRKLWLKPGFLCLVCFFLASAAFFVLGKYYYDRNLQEMKDAEIKAYQARKFSLAGYEIGRDLDCVEGFQRSVYSNCTSRTKSKTEKLMDKKQYFGYHKEIAVDKDEVIDGMEGFSKLTVDALEYAEKGVTRNRICRICLIANGVPEKMREGTFDNYVSILGKRFGRRFESLGILQDAASNNKSQKRFGSRSESLGNLRPQEKIWHWRACISLENGRMLHVHSFEPGHVSVILDCPPPSSIRSQ